MNFKKSIAALMAVITVLFSLCACGKIKSVSVTQGTAVEADNTGKTYCVSQKNIKQMTKLAQSSRVSLFFDKQTRSVCVIDLDTEKIWRSLPQYYNEKAPVTPEILGVTLIADGKTYTLNSQLHSVSNGLATFIKTASGVTVNYTFSFSAEDKTVSLFIPVEYALTDGSLFVSVNCKDILIDSKADVIIREIRLMNFFGSTLKGNTGDYMLVPDGCGAIVRTDTTDEKFKPVQLRVYGEDPASYTKGAFALVGAYGFKQGESAVAAVIENGDSVSTVYSDTVKSCGYNYTGAGFEITPVKSEKNSRLSISEKSYDGEIKLCFRFLSDNNANYAAMASACREQLIRNGTLSQRTLTEDAKLPAIVTVTGAANINGGKSLSALTTFEQAQDMLTFLKAKGFSNIYLRYRGLFDGGLNQTYIKGNSLNEMLGSKADFDALNGYMDAQKLELYFDIDILSASKGSYPKSTAADDIKGSPIRIYVPSRLSKDALYSKNLLALNKLEGTVLDLLTAQRNTNISGFCLNDAGSLLYSDCSDENFTNRQNAKNYIASECMPLVTGRKLMVDTGNVYMLKNASSVSNIPMTTSNALSLQYKAVPFIQMLVHGTMYYSPGALNLEKNPQRAFLRCIEYGAIPSFEWFYTAEESYPQYSYSAWAAQAYEMYERADEALRDISAARITDHYSVGSNVYCTVYSGNTMIYVNYSDKPFEINGTTVEAQNFLRIN